MPLRVQAHLQQRIGHHTSTARYVRTLQRLRERIACYTGEPFCFACVCRSKAGNQLNERVRNASLHFRVEWPAHDREQPEAVRDEHVMKQCPERHVC